MSYKEFDNFDDSVPNPKPKKKRKKRSSLINWKILPTKLHDEMVEIYQKKVMAGKGTPGFKCGRFRSKATRERLIDEIGKSIGCYK